MRPIVNGIATATAIFFLVLVFISNASAQTYTLDQVLTKMGEVNKNLRSMEASLERTNWDALLGSDEKQYGKILLKRTQNKPQIRIDFTKPESTVLVTDGLARVYNPKIKQVQEYVIGRDKDPTEFLLIGFGQSNEQIKRTYDTKLIGEESVDNQKTTVIELRPKSPQGNAMFTVIRLWVDQKRWIPLQTKGTEAGGNYLMAKFTNIKLNGDIRDSAFRPNWPKDVQIIR
jgi:outer membrane lipoprotein-sorting protein